MYAVIDVFPHTLFYLSTIHFCKMFNFSALLSKDLSTFVFVVSWLNYYLHVVFYVEFRNFRKKPALEISELKIKPVQPLVG